MTFNLKLTLVMLILTALLIMLGCWQLHRASEKTQLLAQAKFQTTQPFTIWSRDLGLPQAYQPIAVQGSFLPMTFFLDNQYENHQWGYHVLNLLEITAGEIILVDRGWIAGDITRQQLPETFLPRGFQNIRGQAYYPSEKGFVLGDWIEPKTSQIAVIERIDAKSITNLLHKKVYPFIIRLDKRERYGYHRDWLIVSMTPARHQAYAFQWFAMALVVMMIYLGLSFKKTDEHIDV